MKKVMLMFAMGWVVFATACGGTGSDNGNTNNQPATAVDILDPANQDLLNGTITITVAFEGAADQLVLMVDGQSVDTSLITGPQMELTWDSTLTDDGVHEVSVVAGLGGGMVAQSDPIIVETDNTPPEIIVNSLQRPYVYTGTVEYAVEMTDANDTGPVSLKLNGVEVDSSDQAPHLLSWDASSRQDGPVEITLEATDALGNVRTMNLSGVVINQGQAVSFLAGDGSGFFFVPQDYTPGMEVHHKYHWIMPDNITSMMAVVQWEDAGWEMDLAIGTGTCPHSGVTLERVNGDTGQIAINHEAASTYSTEQYFVHFGEREGFDLTQLLGEGTNYWIVVALY